MGDNEKKISVLITKSGVFFSIKIILIFRYSPLPKLGGMV